MDQGFGRKQVLKESCTNPVHNMKGRVIEVDPADIFESSNQSHIITEEEIWNENHGRSNLFEKFYRK